MGNTLSHIGLSEFKRVRALSLSRTKAASIFADMCRVNVLYMVMRAGSGHLGSSFSVLDIVSWIYLNEGAGQKNGPVFFSSKGHDAPGLYAVLMGLGRLDFDLLHRLRRLDGLPGHPDIRTPGVEFNTGSLGMGISKAKGLALAGRLSGKRRRIFVVVGDGELQEGQIWESLLSAAGRKLGELTVIVDHNKIQSDTWVRTVGDLGDLKAKFEAFGWRVHRCNGHDPRALARVFAKLKRGSGRPNVIIADTIKGCGVPFMQNQAVKRGQRLYPYHSGAPSPEDYARALAALKARLEKAFRGTGHPGVRFETVVLPERARRTPAQNLLRAYSAALAEEASSEKRLVVLDADLVKDCGLLEFEKRFPERFIECGIAEQDMVSQAGGLALRGYLPVVHSFACFLATRANEQIFNNATERTRIVYTGSLAGLLPGTPGHSHQSVRDLSALGAVPGLVVIQPADETEMRSALGWALRENPGPTYLRLTSVSVAVPFTLPSGYRMVKGRGVLVREGKDAVVFGYGPVLLSEAFKAADRLSKEQGIELAIVNLPWLNALEEGWLTDTVGELPCVFTLDDHAAHGGQGRMIAARLAALGTRAVVHSFCVEGIVACGNNEEVLRAHGLDAGSLSVRFASRLKKITRPA